jgi:hypothetical protein
VFLRGTFIILAEVAGIVNALSSFARASLRLQFGQAAEGGCPRVNYVATWDFFRIFPQVSSVIIDRAPHLHNFSKTI